MNNLKEKRLIVILGGRFSSKIVFQTLKYNKYYNFVIYDNTLNKKFYEGNYTFIKKVNILEGEKIKEPKDFNLDEFIHKSNLGFEYSSDLYTFSAIFDKTMAAHLEETKLNSSQTIKELDDGRLLISARVPDTLQFEQWLMSFGASVEVLKPEKLRNKFKQLSIDLSNIY